MGGLRVEQFSNQSRADLKQLREFVDFQRDLFANEPRFVPLMRYEFLGSKLLGMKGFYEARHPFFEHGRARFFVVRDGGGNIVARCHAAVDKHYAQHWNENVGFIGSFDAIDSSEAAQLLLSEAEAWLKSQGATRVRGPQHFPFNESTPGVLVEGFESRPVVYYHYNPPYYAKLFECASYHAVKRVKSWEVSVQHNSIRENLARLSQRIIRRSQVKLENWGDRPVAVRIAEMREVYNDAWGDNFGFIPFEKREFEATIKDMQLVMDKSLFIFAYVDGELAGFFGGVPNIFETLALGPLTSRVEILRALALVIRKGSVKGFRLGYLGVKKKFHRLGLDGVMLHQQAEVSRSRGYEYCDMGWVLEDNASVVHLIERCGGVLSKVYAIYEKDLSHRPAPTTRATTDSKASQ